MTAYIKKLTHLIVNRAEAAVLTGLDFEELTLDYAWDKLTDELLEKGVENVVIVLGNGGAFFSQKKAKGIEIKPTIKEAEIKDTTGAE